MHLVGIVSSPTSLDDAVVALAQATGLTRAEARMRLAPEPPALVARTGSVEAAALVASMRRAGVGTLAIEENVPTDADRLVARSFEFPGDGARFTPRAGTELKLPWAEVLGIFRGIRLTRSESEHTEKTRKFSMGRALVTGGVVFSRTTSRVERTSAEAVEQVVLVYSRGGEAVMLAESSVQFSGLGPDLKPSSTANMIEIARQLREKAPAAFYDERLLRLARRPLPFVIGRESRVQAAGTLTTRTATSGTLDILAELMRQALVEGLLP
jgi:hypothetical protein